jgi:hypothetical protein
MTRRGTDTTANGVADVVQRPGGSSVVPVWCAAWALPRAVRDRYRHEFVAELYGMDRARQLRHLGGVLVTIGALRRAVASTPTDDEETAMHHRPFLCTLNVHHVWRTFSTDPDPRVVAA